MKPTLPKKAALPPKELYLPQYDTTSSTAERSEALRAQQGTRRASTTNFIQELDEIQYSSLDNPFFVLSNPHLLDLSIPMVGNGTGKHKLGILQQPANLLLPLGLRDFSNKVGDIIEEEEEGVGNFTQNCNQNLTQNSLDSPPPDYLPFNQYFQREFQQGLSFEQFLQLRLCGTSYPPIQRLTWDLKKQKTPQPQILPLHRVTGIDYFTKYDPKSPPPTNSLHQINAMNYITPLPQFTPPPPLPSQHYRRRLYLLPLTLSKKPTGGYIPPNLLYNSITKTLTSAFMTNIPIVGQYQGLSELNPAPTHQNKAKNNDNINTLSGAGSTTTNATNTTTTTTTESNLYNQSPGQGVLYLTTTDFSKGALYQGTTSMYNTKSVFFNNYSSRPDSILVLRDVIATREKKKEQELLYRQQKDLMFSIFNIALEQNEVYWLEQLEYMLLTYTEYDFKAQYVYVKHLQRQKVIEVEKKLKETNLTLNNYDKNNAKNNDKNVERNGGSSSSSSSSSISNSSQSNTDKNNIDTLSRSSSMSRSALNQLSRVSSKSSLKFDERDSKSSINSVKNTKNQSKLDKKSKKKAQLDTDSFHKSSNSNSNSNLTKNDTNSFRLPSNPVFYSDSDSDCDMEGNPCYIAQAPSTTTPITNQTGTNFSSDDYYNGSDYDYDDLDDSQVNNNGKSKIFLEEREIRRKKFALKIAKNEQILKEITQILSLLSKARIHVNIHHHNTIQPPGPDGNISANNLTLNNSSSTIFSTTNTHTHQSPSFSSDYSLSTSPSTLLSSPSSATLITSTKVSTNSSVNSMSSLYSNHTVTQSLQQNKIRHFQELQALDGQYLSIQPILTWEEIFHYVQLLLVHVVNVATNHDTIVYTSQLQSNKNDKNKGPAGVNSGSVPIPPNSPTDVMGLEHFVKSRPVLLLLVDGALASMSKNSDSFQSMLFDDDDDDGDGDHDDNRGGIGGVKKGTQQQRQFDTFTFSQTAPRRTQKKHKLTDRLLQLVQQTHFELFHISFTTLLLQYFHFSPYSINLAPIDTNISLLQRTPSSSALHQPNGAPSTSLIRTNSNSKLGNGNTKFGTGTGTQKNSKKDDKKIKNDEKFDTPFLLRSSSHLNEIPTHNTRLDGTNYALFQPKRNSNSRNTFNDYDVIISPLPQQQQQQQSIKHTLLYSSAIPWISDHIWNRIRKIETLMNQHKLLTQELNLLLWMVDDDNDDNNDDNDDNSTANQKANRPLAVQNKRSDQPIDPKTSPYYNKHTPIPKKINLSSSFVIHWFHIMGASPQLLQQYSNKPNVSPVILANIKPDIKPSSAMTSALTTPYMDKHGLLQKRPYSTTHNSINGLNDTLDSTFQRIKTMNYTTDSGVKLIANPLLSPTVRSAYNKINKRNSHKPGTFTFEERDKGLKDGGVGENKTNFGNNDGKNGNKLTPQPRTNISPGPAPNIDPIYKSEHQLSNRRQSNLQLSIFNNFESEELSQITPISIHSPTTTSITPSYSSPPLIQNRPPPPPLIKPALPSQSINSLPSLAPNSTQKGPNITLSVHTGSYSNDFSTPTPTQAPLQTNKKVSLLTSTSTLSTLMHAALAPSLDIRTHEPPADSQFVQLVSNCVHTMVTLFVQRAGMTLYQFSLLNFEKSSMERREQIGLMKKLCDYVYGGHHSFLDIARKHVIFDHNQLEEIQEFFSTQFQSSDKNTKNHGIFSHRLHDDNIDPNNTSYNSKIQFEIYDKNTLPKDKIPFQLPPPPSLKPQTSKLTSNISFLGQKPSKLLFPNSSSTLQSSIFDTTPGYNSFNISSLSPYQIARVLPEMCTCISDLHTDTQNLCSHLFPSERRQNIYSKTNSQCAGGLGRGSICGASTIEMSNCIEKKTDLPSPLTDHIASPSISKSLLVSDSLCTPSKALQAESPTQTIQNPRRSVFKQDDAKPIRQRGSILITQQRRQARRSMKPNFKTLLATTSTSEGHISNQQMLANIAKSTQQSTPRRFSIVDGPTGRRASLYQPPVAVQGQNQTLSSSKNRYLSNIAKKAFSFINSNDFDFDNDLHKQQTPKYMPPRTSSITTRHFFTRPNSPNAFFPPINQQSSCVAAEEGISAPTSSIVNSMSGISGFSGFGGDEHTVGMKLNPYQATSAMISAPEIVQATQAYYVQHPEEWDKLFEDFFTPIAAKPTKGAGNSSKGGKNAQKRRKPPSQPLPSTPTTALRQISSRTIQPQRGSTKEELMRKSTKVAEFYSKRSTNSQLSGLNSTQLQAQLGAQFPAKDEPKMPIIISNEINTRPKIQPGTGIADKDGFLRPKVHCTDQYFLKGDIEDSETAIQNNPNNSLLAHNPNYYARKTSFCRPITQVKPIILKPDQIVLNEGNSVEFLDKNAENYSKNDRLERRCSLLLLPPTRSPPPIPTPRQLPPPLPLNSPPNTPPNTPQMFYNDIKSTNQRPVSTCSVQTINYGDDVVEEFMIDDLPTPTKIRKNIARNAQRNQIYSPSRAQYTPLKSPPLNNHGSQHRLNSADNNPQNSSPKHKNSILRRMSKQPSPFAVSALLTAAALAQAMIDIKTSQKQNELDLMTIHEEDDETSSRGSIASTSRQSTNNMTKTGFFPVGRQMSDGEVIGENGGICKTGQNSLNSNTMPTIHDSEYDFIPPPPPPREDKVLLPSKIQQNTQGAPQKAPLSIDVNQTEPIHDASMLYRSPIRRSVVPLVIDTNQHTPSHNAAPSPFLGASVNISTPTPMPPSQTPATATQNQTLTTRTGRASFLQFSFNRTSVTSTLGQAVNPSPKSSPYSSPSTTPTNSRGSAHTPSQHPLHQPPHVLQHNSVPSSAELIAQKSTPPPLKSTIIPPPTTHLSSLPSNESDEDPSLTLPSISTPRALQNSNIRSKRDSVATANPPNVSNTRRMSLFLSKIINQVVEEKQIPPPPPTQHSSSSIGTVPLPSLPEVELNPSMVENGGRHDNGGDDNEKVHTDSDTLTALPTINKPPSVPTQLTRTQAQRRQSVSIALKMINTNFTFNQKTLPPTQQPNSFRQGSIQMELPNKFRRITTLNTPVSTNRSPFFKENIENSVINSNETIGTQQIGNNVRHSRGRSLTHQLQSSVSIQLAPQEVVQQKQKRLTTLQREQQNEIMIEQQKYSKMKMEQDLLSHTNTDKNNQSNQSNTNHIQRNHSPSTFTSPLQTQASYQQSNNVNEGKNSHVISLMSPGAICKPPPHQQQPQRNQNPVASSSTPSKNINIASPFRKRASLLSLCTIAQGGSNLLSDHAAKSLNLHNPHRASTIQHHSAHNTHVNGHGGVIGHHGSVGNGYNSVKLIPQNNAQHHSPSIIPSNSVNMGKSLDANIPTYIPEQLSQLEKKKKEAEKIAQKKKEEREKGEQYYEKQLQIEKLRFEEQLQRERAEKEALQQLLREQRMKELFNAPQSPPPPPPPPPNRPHPNHIDYGGDNSAQNGTNRNSQHNNGQSNHIFFNQNNNNNNNNNNSNVSPSESPQQRPFRNGSLCESTMAGLSLPPPQMLLSPHNINNNKNNNLNSKFQNNYQTHYQNNVFQNNYQHNFPDNHNNNNNNQPQNNYQNSNPNNTNNLHNNASHHNNNANNQFTAPNALFSPMNKYIEPQTKLDHNRNSHNNHTNHTNHTNHSSTLYNHTQQTQSRHASPAQPFSNNSSHSNPTQNTSQQACHHHNHNNGSSTTPGHRYKDGKSNLPCCASHGPPILSPTFTSPANIRSQMRNKCESDLNGSMGLNNNGKR